MDEAIRDCVVYGISDENRISENMTLDVCSGNPILDPGVAFENTEPLAREGSIFIFMASPVYNDNRRASSLFLDVCSHRDHRVGLFGRSERTPYRCLWGEHRDENGLVSHVCLSDVSGETPPSEVVRPRTPDADDGVAIGLTRRRPANFFCPPGGEPAGWSRVSRRSGPRIKTAQYGIDFVHFPSTDGPPARTDRALAQVGWGPGDHPRP